MARMVGRRIRRERAAPPLPRHEVRARASVARPAPRRDAALEAPATCLPEGEGDEATWPRDLDENDTSSIRYSEPISRDKILPIKIRKRPLGWSRGAS